MPPSNMSPKDTLVISPSPRAQLSPYKRKQEKCKTILTQLWGDQEWYPERVRSQHKHREIQPAVLEKLIAVTNLALRKGIEKEDLPTLWDEDGALSWAMAQQDSRLLTVDVCNKAMEYLENHREADEAGNQAKSPTALHHPQAIEQEVLVKVEPSNSSGADEDLPADSEPTQHSSPTKKRKASSDPIDLTNRTPPPERDRLTKERQQNARLAAEELYSQLHSDARLEDEPIFHMCEVSFALYHTEKQYLLDCLWFEVDSGSLPAKLQDFPQQEGEHYLPLHHRDPEHWTLCVLVVTEGRVHCAFYDPLEGGSTWRAKVTESRLKEWIDEHYPSLTFAFEKKTCVEQDDGVSCGIFVLVYLRRLLMSESVNKTLDPIKARAELWDDVLRADASSLLLKEGTRSLLREIQAIEKEKNDSDAVAQVSAPGDITGEPLNSYPLFEKLTRPGNLDVFREECQKKMQALVTAQSNLQAARRAHLNAAEKAAWTQEAFDDVFNSLAKIGEGCSIGGVPSRAPEKDLTVTLEDSHPADPMRSSDTPVRDMSVIISKAVTDCERVAQEMQRERFNRVIEKKIAAGRQRVKIEEQRESELSEEVKTTTNEVAALQRVIKVAEGRLELENEESRAYLERFYTSM